MTESVPGHADYVLGLADDALVSAQRTGWWISRAPELEEDVALANIGLDQLGQARTLLAHAGRLEGDGRGEDVLAYWRDERGHYDFGEVDFTELFEVIKGNGPCNAERMAHKVRAHEDGAWVREAASAYAEKHARKHGRGAA